MKNILIILVLIAFYFFLGLNEVIDETQHGKTAIITGIILLSAFLFANVIKKLKLPKITGYMIIGIILGPIGFKILTHETIDNLAFLENLALSLIAITAGGEFKFDKFKIYKKSISSILFFQIFIVFVGTGIIFFATANYFNLLNKLDTSILIGFAILFSGAAISTSPAVTIGIITELKSRGKITDIVLMVTVFKAIALVLLFPAIITYAKYFLIEETELNIGLFTTVFLQLGTSVLTGIILGVLTIWYLKVIKIERSIFLLGITIVITEISTLLGVEILLTSIITGIIVQNFSKEGDSLISGIEMFSLPLYVLFFCFAGAGLHLGLILNVLPITIFLVLLRLVLIFVGNYAGSVFAKEDNLVKKYSWLGYAGQAGIALGLGIIIERTFPGDIGEIFLTIMIATVVINELIGPILFKYVLIKVNESNEDGVEK
ncbi:MAG: cation:proton antiporter [Calditrichia bacterium]|nr:cation:proton antiporter [Calditrichia bacterium]